MNQLKCYLLNAQEHGIYLAFGVDCMEAAKSLAPQIGLTEADIERFSVSGSWVVTEETVIDVGAFWPHFTNTPTRKHTCELLKNQKPS